MSNHLLSIVSRSHYHSQKVIGSLGRSWAALKDSSHIDGKVCKYVVISVDLGNLGSPGESWIILAKIEQDLSNTCFFSTAVVDFDTFSANGKPFNFGDCTI